LEAVFSPSERIIVHQLIFYAYDYSTPIFFSKNDFLKNGAAFYFMPCGHRA
jgi:hypothetical protein